MAECENCKRLEEENRNLRQMIEDLEQAAITDQLAIKVLGRGRLHERVTNN
jgi:hypothetical protein